MCRIELDELFKSFIGINALERFHSVGSILFLIEFSNVIQEILVSFSKSSSDAVLLGHATYTYAFACQFLKTYA